MSRRRKLRARGQTTRKVHDEYCSSSVKKTSAGEEWRGGEGARLRGTVDRTEKKKHTTLEDRGRKEGGFAGICKVGASFTFYTVG